MSKPASKDAIIERLNVLADSYNSWIQQELVDNVKMQDGAFRKELATIIIAQCRLLLSRIKDGISLIINDEIAFDAFCFMNRVMRREIL